MNQLICAAGTCRTQQQARKHRVSPGPAFRLSRWQRGFSRLENPRRTWRFFDGKSWVLMGFNKVLMGNHGKKMGFIPGSFSGEFMRI